MSLNWNKETTPRELHSILQTLADEFPIRENAENANLFFEQSTKKDELSVRKKDGTWVIRYEKPSFAARGIAYALSGQECRETICFDTHSILLDCSRTGVVTPAFFKRWLRRLALLGYNMAMLYTKDAYSLPGEQYFGYMRGAYSMEEIREIDSYAKLLGIEIIASIQALGHLEPIMRWPAYDKVKDTNNVILVDYEGSYTLLEKMIHFWSEALDSRRIHLGMDETHDLGRGVFMNMHGYERPFDIYNRHLGRVCEICSKLDLKPIIWNDMYFRYANNAQNYYDLSSPIPEDVRQAIPKMVQLSYWDYYHRDQATYKTMLARTEELNNRKPIMASGIWTWVRLWCDFEMTFASVAPCIDACRAQNIREIIYTMWGDDGGYCEFESAFAGMAWTADRAFNGEVCEARLSALFKAVFGTAYELQVELGSMEITCREAPDDPKRWYNIPAAAVLWDDPLMGINWHEMLAKRPDIWVNALTHYKKLRDKAGNFREDRNAGNIDHAWLILDVLAKKVELRITLTEAYAKRNKTELQIIRDQHIPEVIEALNKLCASYRNLWKRSYKPYGLEILQIRLAGLRERYAELGRRIGELLDDENAVIEELELTPKTIGHSETRYAMLATGGWFI